MWSILSGGLLIICVYKGRTHLEVFVGVIALLHVGLLASMWQIIFRSAAGFNVVWAFLCILIGIYGIFCTKPPLSL